MHPGSAFARPPFAATPPDTKLSPIYPDDVGPLLAQAALMRDLQPIDDVTRALLVEATSRALTGEASFKAL